MDLIVSMFSSVDGMFFILWHGDEGFHPRPQFADVDRFGHVHITTRVQCLFCIAFQRIGRDGNNRRMRRAALLLLRSRRATS